MKKNCLYCLHEVKGYCVQQAMRIDKPIRIVECMQSAIDIDKVMYIKRVRFILSNIKEGE